MMLLYQISVLLLRIDQDLRFTGSKAKLELLIGCYDASPVAGYRRLNQAYQQSKFKNEK